MTNLRDIDADAIWDVLVTEAKATEGQSAREGFRQAWEHPDTGTRPFEYRFGGSLGEGGKVWWNPPGPPRGRCPLFVTCYAEDRTSERIDTIKAANARLKALVMALPREPFVKGEQPVRVEGYPGTWTVFTAESDGFVELRSESRGVLGVNATKVHRGHMEWQDDD